MRSIRRDNLIDLLKNYIRHLNIGQIILIVASFGLSIWCVYNVAIILSKYYEYETIITLENESPSKTAFPGITICAPSIFKPQKLAEIYPKFNDSLNEFIKWQREHRFDIELNTTALQNRYNEFRMYESMALAKFSASYIIKNLSVRPEELLVDCKYHPVNIRNFQISRKENQHVVINPKQCSQIQQVLESIYESKKCFTFFSDLFEMEKPNADDNIKEFITNDDNNQTLRTTDGKPQKEEKRFDKKKWSEEFKSLLVDTKDQMVFDLNPSIELQIKALDEDLWVSYMMDPILMTVHPPNILQNRRDFLFWQVSRSNIYEITFTKKTTKLMKPPFKTKCVEYKKSPKFIKENTKTRDHCISFCINRSKETQADKCANYYSVLADDMFVNDMKDMKICDHTHQDYNSFLKARATCEKNCPNDCQKIIFEVTGQMRSMITTDCPEWYNPRPRDTESDRDDDEVSEAEIESFDNETTNNTSLDLVRMGTFTAMRKWSPTISPTLASAAAVYFTGSYYTSVKSNRVKSKCDAKVSIRISPKPFTTVKHQQAITYEGFLGTIGGHLGIWLGLSLYKIIKFAVHILYNLLHKAVQNFVPNFLAQVPKSGLSSRRQ